MADADYDVVVVGSGLAGLTTGIFLAKFGRRVALVEARKELGGVSSSFRRRGVDCPVGIHYFGAAGEGELVRRVWDVLGLAIPLRAAGVEGPLSRYHFEAETFELPVGFDALEATLAAAVPDERDQVRQIIASLRDAAEPLRMQKRRGEFNPFESTAEYFARLGCSPRLEMLLSGPEAWLGMSKADCPRSSYDMALASYMLSSFRLACTGAEFVARHVARFRELGGEVLAGDGVRRLSFTAEGASGASEVTGVTLASGRELRAPQVVLTQHPKRAVELFGEEPALVDFGQRILALPESSTASMGFALVDAERTPARGHNTYQFRVDQRSWFQVTPSGKPGKNLLCVVAGDRLANWQRWEASTLGERGADYLDAKAALGESLAAEVGRVADVAGLEWLELFTPLSFRDWVGGFGGSLYGVSGGGMALAGLNRVGVRGLRFAGQSVMAPGVIGVLFSALRVAGDLVGRRAIADLLGGAA